ncbi:GntR family transcriptional regulator [Streptomyces sp. TLI_171]|uniref:GntR family transcriptional regulator n=1 Tax=Streptomyces sp. TLI_171 TaxID=1938859 RepID=UPI0015D55DC7|nr:winged helix-turn-helix domain-containing protein [Streptomyces sp. TLI_171]
MTRPAQPTGPAQPYMRVVLDVQQRIRSGRLAVDDKLPSTRELSEEFGVATGTIQRALGQLKTEGWIYSHQGLGSYVRGIPVDDDAASASAGALSRLSDLERRVLALEDELRQLRGDSA